MKKKGQPPRGLPARGGSYVPVERRTVSGSEKKKGKAQSETTVCDVANVALFGNVPTVDFD